MKKGGRVDSPVSESLPTSDCLQLSLKSEVGLVSSEVVLLVTFLHLLGVVEKILQHEHSRSIGFVVSSSIEFTL